MNISRRNALKCCAGLAVMACSGVSTAEGEVLYSRELYEELLASGEGFILDFTAPW